MGGREWEGGAKWEGIGRRAYAVLALVGILLVVYEELTISITCELRLELVCEDCYYCFKKKKQKKQKNKEI